MKKKLPVIIFLLIFISGLSLLLYPTFSDWWNRNHQSKAIVEYNKIIKYMSDEERNALWSAADDYNRRLFEFYCGGSVTEEELMADYPTLLNIYGDGMMGHIHIPRLNISIPIMHTTSESVLQNAVGHLETSSLPVGGENTHCVLSRHTGLPSARLFTDLEQMVIGDLFTIEVLGVKMSYQVDQILIVLPWETEALEISAGADYCTLITCTPYGVNSHRILVRGTRIGTAYSETSNAQSIEIEDDQDITREEQVWWLRDKLLPVYVAAGSVALLTALLIIASAVRRAKKKKALSEDINKPDKE